MNSYSITCLVILEPPSKSGCSQLSVQLAAVNSWNQGFLGWPGRSGHLTISIIMYSV